MTMGGPAVGLIFSGQGAQRPGMGRPWVSSDSWRLLAGMSEAVGRDLAALLLDADARTLERTDNAQLATFALQMVVLDELRVAGLPHRSVVACAGHSLGEYSALVAAGMLSRERGAELVLARGRAMLAATVERPGTMGVVRGIPPAEVERIVSGLRARGAEVWVANLNSPDQTVVSGAVGAVAAAEAECAALGARPARVPVGGAFHTPLMTPAAALLSATFAGLRTRPGEIPVVSNVDARPHRWWSDWPQLVAHQVVSPVRWESAVRCLVDELGCDLLVEIGAGSTLTDLYATMGLPATALAVDGPAALRRVLDTVTGWRPPAGVAERSTRRTAARRGPGGSPPPARASATRLRWRGRPPYGYRVEAAVDGGGRSGPVMSTLVADDLTAPVVRRIFRRYADGVGLQGIAEELTADWVLSPSAHDRSRNPQHGGVAWSKGAVRAILVNPRYAGRPPRGAGAQPGSGILPAYPPLVDGELFDQVQQAFETRRSDRAGPGDARRYVLRGRLRCALCGRLMQGTWNNADTYYRCRFPGAYAAANEIRHPRNVYLRERRLVGPLDAVLAGPVARRVAEHAASARCEPDGRGDELAVVRRRLIELVGADPEQRSRTYDLVRLRLTYSVEDGTVRARVGLGPQNLVLREVVDLSRSELTDPQPDDSWREDS
jgi:[acyl-carrier-protein] S-malonyltransferase